MRKLTIASIAIILFTILSVVAYKQITKQNISKELMVNLEQAQAHTEENRQEFYELIQNAELRSFIDAKTEEEIVKRKLKYYIDNQEELEITEEGKGDIEEQATADVLQVFIEKILENNDLQKEVFNDELSVLNKKLVIKTLRGNAQPIAQKLVEASKANGITLYIYEGLRSAERQNKLYEKGRSTPGNIVTNAKAWESMHQYGYAFDVVCIIDGKPNWKDCKWDTIAKIGKGLGLEWGGDWEFIDKPHFQLKKKYWDRESKVKQFVCNRNIELCGIAEDFVKVGVENKIDPYLLVAIAVADTSLGVHLKTPYNIGNVGNIDFSPVDGKTCIGRTSDGCSRDFNSWYEGISAMSTTTALRMNETVGALSPYPTCYQPNNIHYAKSTKNWFENVSSIMSQLHGFTVGCDYKYKLQ